MFARCYYVILTSLSLFFGCKTIVEKKCLFDLVEKNTIIVQPYHASPPVTIWVHGTRAFFSKYFFHNFFYCPPGLNPARTLNMKYHLRSVAALLSNAAPDSYSFEHFYFFGWSGKLKHKARLKAARELYEAIIKLITEYKAIYNRPPPSIRVITHSHGGNVVLNMTKVKGNECLFSIDELILLACPVQTETSCFVDDCLFKNIYALYSKRDSIQILDPQGLHYWRKKHKLQKPTSFFSERCFATSKKVRHVQLKLNGSGLMHIDFLFHKFLQHLPAIINEIESWDHNTIENKPEVLSIRTVKKKS